MGDSAVWLWAGCVRNDVMEQYVVNEMDAGAAARGRNKETREGLLGRGQLPKSRDGGLHGRQVASPATPVPSRDCFNTPRMTALVP